MVSRTVVVAGIVGVVGAATAGGYYVAKMQAPPQPVTQTPPVQQQAAPQPQQEPAPSQTAAASPPAQQYTAPQQYTPAAPAPYEPQRRREYRRDFDQYHRVSFGYFHDELEPYGDWRYSDRWGEVWRPRDNDNGFRPYSRGHWANTREYGWTWVSDEPWGGIAYHYGRWVEDPDQGWIWIPGYVWGPGWVSWRSGGGYTGWRPMPPDREFLQNGENRRDHWTDPGADNSYHQWYGYDQNKLDSQWTFVDTGHFGDRDYRGHEYSRPEDTQRMMPQTSDVTNYDTVNNYVVNRSIDTRSVEQASGRPVATMPASTVVPKPELITPADTGHQVQVQMRSQMPSGTGRPNSAPPPALGQTNTPSTPTNPATAPAQNAQPATVPAANTQPASTPPAQPDNRHAPDARGGNHGGNSSEHNPPNAAGPAPNNIPAVPVQGPANPATRQTPPPTPASGTNASSGPDMHKDTQGGSMRANPHGANGPSSPPATPSNGSASQGPASPAVHPANGPAAGATLPTGTHTTVAPAQPSGAFGVPQAPKPTTPNAVPQTPKPTAPNTVPPPKNATPLTPAAGAMPTTPPTPPAKDEHKKIKKERPGDNGQGNTPQN